MAEIEQSLPFNILSTYKSIQALKSFIQFTHFMMIFQILEIFRNPDIKYLFIFCNSVVKSLYTHCFYFISLTLLILSTYFLLFFQTFLVGNIFPYLIFGKANCRKDAFQAKSLGGWRNIRGMILACSNHVFNKFIL